ncbi:TPA: Rha family transcriptional regulator, partial [Enterococcus faecalis]
MTQLVIMKDQQAVTSSLQVAEVFGKEHKVVLKAIDELKQGVAQNYADLFYDDSYIHLQNKQSYRQVIMNRDGFTLLAMGFTGQKVLQFKLKYIEAFNQMENHIKEQLDTST